MSDDREKPTADDRTLRFETRAIHAGQDPDAPYGAVNVPIYQTSTYAQPAVGEPKVWDYARGGNPTREALQIALAALEGGERGFAFGSGMGAETTLLLTLQPGRPRGARRRRLRRHLPAPVEGAERLGPHDVARSISGDLDALVDAIDVVDASSCGSRRPRTRC